MTTPPAGPGGYPGQFGPAGAEDRTRPVHSGAYQQGAQQTSAPTQYAPPEQPGWPQQSGGHPQPAQSQYGQPQGWPQQQQGWPQQQGGYPPFQPPPPSGGGNRTGLIVGIVVLVLVLVGGGAGWYFFLGPGASKQPAANPSSASGPAAPSGSSGGTAGGSSAGAAPAPGADKGGDVDVDVAVGDCVNLSGSDANADAKPADCGTTDANYKVIGKAPTQAQCVSDADATYFESLGGTEVGALCLDVDWVKGDCYDLSGLDPARVSCTGAGSSKRVKVGDTIQGTTSLSRCPDSGYQYDERKFVVCLNVV